MENELREEVFKFAVANYHFVMIRFESIGYDSSIFEFVSFALFERDTEGFDRLDYHAAHYCGNS